MATLLGRGRDVPRDAPERPAQTLRPRHVPLPVWRRAVQLARDASEADARAAALAADGIEARLAGQTVRKFVCVPGQIMNLVVG